VDHAADEETGCTSERSECEPAREIGRVAQHAPEHPYVDHEQEQPQNQRRNAAFERDL